MRHCTTRLSLYDVTTDHFVTGSAHLVEVEAVGDDVDEDNVKINNPMQRNAIHQALRSTFSLIQGPPGLTKEFIVLKLYCGYKYTKSYMINRIWGLKQL